MENRVSAVLLASGFSRRMGEDKLLLTFNGTTLLQKSVDLLSSLPVYEKIIVATAERAESIAIPPGIQVVVNANPEAGQSESVKLGVSMAAGDWYIFMAADQPKLTVTDMQPFFDAVGQGNGSIIYPVINGYPSSPTLFSSCFRSDLLSLTGDTGGRAVRERNREVCVEIEPEYPGNFIDIDNMEDYHSLTTDTELSEKNEAY